MALLPHPQILQIHAAAVEARLTDSREALLAGMDLHFRASMLALPTRGDQILGDLAACNDAGKLADGSVPLRVWLANALSLAGQRAQAEVFRRALGSLGRDPEGKPLPTVPPPGAGQTWNNLPPKREFFVGRKMDLTALDGALERGRHRVSIHGLAGVGKTTLALTYAHRAVVSGRYPGGVYWLGAEGEPQQAFVRLASQLENASPRPIRSAIQEAQSRDKSTAGLTDALRLVLQNHPEPSLLVLDNVNSDGWKELAPSGEVRLVSTVRDARWAIGERHRLEALPPDEATELSTLIAGQPRDEDERATQRWVIGTELGGHAVAVEMASRAVELLGLSWAAYKQGWRERAAAMSSNQELRPDYPRGVFEAIDLSLDLCPRGAPRELLEGAAVFAPEEVPWAWAAEAAGLDPTDWDTKAALAKLKGLGLVRVGRDGEALSMHRLVHGRMRERADHAWALFCGRGAAVVVRWLEQTVDPTRMAEIDARRPHVDEALVAAERARRAEAWIDIADRLATHLQYRGLYHEAHALFERAVQKAEAAKPPDPARVARSLSNLSLVLQYLGRAEEARPLLVRSLEIAEEIYGADHPKVATRLSNLAAVLLAIGEAEEALPLSRRAAELLEKTYDSAHPRMAAPLSSLAAALHSLGAAEEALPVSKRSLAIAEKTYGAEHPRVASYLSMLAMVLKDLGQAGKAHELFMRAHAIAEKTYGPEHPKVAATLSDLAEVMLYLGKEEEALVFLERAVAIDEKAYGTEHPRVAQRRSILGGAVSSLVHAIDPILSPPMAIDEQAYDRIKFALGKPLSKRGYTPSTIGGTLSNGASIWSGVAVDRSSKEQWLERVRIPGEPKHISMPMEMVHIPGGTFWMGSDDTDEHAEPDEQPRHQVTLSPFWMGRVPVTQRLYREVVGENPGDPVGDDLPINNVSWWDAIRFCNWLSEMEGLTPAYRAEGSQVVWIREANGYRLPTEAEWEYAARGTDGRIYPWGNEPPCNQLRRDPSPVGSYPAGASPFGLLDMAGNVWEWTADAYRPYEATAQKDPYMAPSPMDELVVRGGSSNEPWASHVRAAFRDGYIPAFRYGFVGFRCARGPG